MDLRKLESPQTGEMIVFDLDNGGTVTSMVLGKDKREILYNDSGIEYESNPLFRGRFLFPFNDRIPEGRYSFGGREYHLDINNPEDGSAIHGFMYNRRIKLLSLEEAKAAVYWSTGEDEIPGYPFSVSLTIDFSLSPGRVDIGFTVKNEGSTAAPFALGWHSYFRTLSSSVLTAAFPCYFRIDDTFLPVGDCVSVYGTEYDFSRGRSPGEMTAGGRILDNTFSAPEKGGVVLDNGDYKVSISQKNFPYTQLFIPPDGESIAIEPITSKPNSFNSPEVLTLSPGNVYTAQVRIESWIRS